MLGGSLHGIVFMTWFPWNTGAIIACFSCVEWVRDVFHTCGLKVHWKVYSQCLELHTGGQVKEQMLAEPRAHERQDLHKGIVIRPTVLVGRGKIRTKSKRVWLLVKSRWTDGMKSSGCTYTHIYPRPAHESSQRVQFWLDLHNLIIAHRSKFMPSWGKAEVTGSGWRTLVGDLCAAYRPSTWRATEDQGYWSWRTVLLWGNAGVTDGHLTHHHRQIRRKMEISIFTKLCKLL